MLTLYKTLFFSTAIMTLMTHSPVIASDQLETKEEPKVSTANSGGHHFGNPYAGGHHFGNPYAGGN